MAADDEAYWDTQIPPPPCGRCGGPTAWDTSRPHKKRWSCASCNAPPPTEYHQALRAMRGYQTRAPLVPPGGQVDWDTMRFDAARYEVSVKVRRDKLP